MVSEAKLPVCYISQPKPGLLWKASCFMPREIVWGMTEAEAKDGLKQTLGPLAALGIHWIDGPEPGPKRPGGPSIVNAPAIEGDTDTVKFHRLVLRAFHPDLHGAKKRWSADQIVAAINQAWQDSTRANG
jgi:hypothetical protein